jgi:MFS family permease
VTSPTLLVARHRHARGARHHRAAATPVREIAAASVACLALAAVIPLALTQIPNGLAWSLPHIQLTDPGSRIAVLRACGLSLPVMLATVPCAAVVIRKIGTGWPVLLAGLMVIALADLVTGLPWLAESRQPDPSRLLAYIAVDRTLHGLGAGLALPGAVTLAGGSRRGVMWSLATSAGLAGAPLLIRARMTNAEDWLNALRPVPWLTTLGLAAVAGWLLLAGRTRWRRGPRRQDAGERDRLALVAAPLAALALMMIAVSFRSVAALVGTAISGVVVVLILTVLLARDSGRAFECVCALAGFTLMPGASVLTGVHPLPSAVSAMLIAIAAAGFAVALAHTLGAAAADMSAALINGTVLLIGAAGAGYLAVGAMMVHG